jgi:hypothetical protein
VSTILVKIGRKYYKVKVNPSPQKLRGAISRQKARGRLASVVRLELKLRKLLKNPLIASADKAAIGANIRYLMAHPKELTAKTKEMRRKQAIAIAMSVWRKAAGMPRYKR